MVYGTLLLVAMVAMAAAFLTRAEVRLNVVRDRSVMARMVDQGAVANRVHPAADERFGSCAVLACRGGTGHRTEPDPPVHRGPATGPGQHIHGDRPHAHAAAALKAGQIIDIHFEVSDPDHLSLKPVREPSTFIVPR